MLNLCLGRETSLHYISCLGVSSAFSTKSASKHVFFHPVGSAGHIVCSGGSGVDLTKNTLGHITLNLCFCIRLYLQVT
jgi:hypothetical protein